MHHRLSARDAHAVAHLAAVLAAVLRLRVFNGENALTLVHCHLNGQRMPIQSHQGLILISLVNLNSLILDVGDVNAVLGPDEDRRRFRFHDAF